MLFRSDTLLREYRRDVGRYLRYQANAYPSLPRDYFDCSTEQTLTALQEKALHRRSKEILAGVTNALEGKAIDNTWRPAAVRVYRNWLKYIGPG